MQNPKYSIEITTLSGTIQDLMSSGTQFKSNKKFSVFNRLGGSPVPSWRQGIKSQTPGSYKYMTYLGTLLAPLYDVFMVLAVRVLDLTLQNLRTADSR